MLRLLIRRLRTLSSALLFTLMVIMCSTRTTFLRVCLSLAVTLNCPRGTMKVLMLVGLYRMNRFSFQFTVLWNVRWRLVVTPRLR